MFRFCLFELVHFFAEQVTMLSYLFADISSVRMFSVHSSFKNNFQESRSLVICMIARLSQVASSH